MTQIQLDQIQHILRYHYHCARRLVPKGIYNVKIDVERESVVFTEATKIDTLTYLIPNEWIIQSYMDFIHGIPEDRPTQISLTTNNYQQQST